MNELKDSGVLLHLIDQALVDLNVNREAIFQACGITTEMLTAPYGRTPHEAQGKFWTTAEHITGDQNIGLHIAQRMPLFCGQVLEYFFLSGETFGQALKLGLRYQRLLSDAVKAELFDTDSECCIALSGPLNGKAIRHLNECTMLGLIRFFKEVTDHSFVPQEVHFQHQAPANIVEHQELLGCKVLFNQADNRLCFNQAVLEFRPGHADTELFKLHQQVALSQLGRLEKQDIIAQVNILLESMLSSGKVSLDTVASGLGMTSRTLRGRLSEAGTSFNQLLTSYRCNLAKQLLSDTEEPIDEIVYMTGFSEPSTFYRAFRRWTNMTPVAYRNKKRGDKACLQHYCINEK